MSALDFNRKEDDRDEEFWNWQSVWLSGAELGPDDIYGRRSSGDGTASGIVYQKNLRCLKQTSGDEPGARSISHLLAEIEGKRELLRSRGQLRRLSFSEQRKKR